MKAAYYEQQGPAREVLQVAEVATPEPAQGEVRVRLHTSGVNPSDVKSRGSNAVRPMPGPRVIPHSDGAGVIDAVSGGVPASRVGERVWTWNAAFMRSQGTCAEYITLPAEQAEPALTETFARSSAINCLSLRTPGREKLLVFGKRGTSSQKIFVAGDKALIPASSASR